ncbi:MAG: PVC-type heme-binding CxxCH protein [Rhodothermales bacterium]|nr:PVC-type heme-binding CxxCH protein [Rhodothermales bacterium]
MRFVSIVFLLLVTIVAACAQKPSRYPDPLSPEDALASFELVEGFTVSVFAAEPAVADPVELVFDERGRAWVVEMPDYPDKPALGQGRSRIVLLTDTDGDGRADRRTVFADNLSEATSVLPWKNGLIVTAAPDILYLVDSDGDDRADSRDILFTGFFENNSEAQITNLRLNPDGWIYAANFGQAGTITSPLLPGVMVHVQGADFRFRLDPPRFEPAAGPTQFGQAVDAWGNRFGTHNTQHINQFVIPWHYLHRHPHLRSAASIVNISDHDLRMYQRTPAPYWRATRTARRQQQYDEAGSGRVEYAADHFTGSSGGTVYDGDLFPERYRGAVFTGDVAGNLVHRDSLGEKAGSPEFIAKRPFDEQEREFMASTDPWFRPAHFTIGPDGALYIVDMYRQHIETPVSIPEDLKEDMDFYAGEDRGRLFRIAPTGAAPTPFVSLHDASTANLVAELAHPNGWRRRTAQRLLLERDDPAAIDPLRATLAGHDAPARLLALYLLDALDALRETDIRATFQDAEAGIRIHALRLSEAYPALASDALALLEDPTPRVAMQAALSAGDRTGRTVTDALAGFVERHAGDRWMRLAVVSAPPGASHSMLAALERRGFFNVQDPARAAFLQETASVLTARSDADELNRFIDFLVDHPEPFWLAAGFTGMKEGHKAGTTLPLNDRAADNLQAFIRSSSEIVQQLAGDILALTPTR